MNTSTPASKISHTCSRIPCFFNICSALLSINVFSNEPFIYLNFGLPSEFAFWWATITFSESVDTTKFELVNCRVSEPVLGSSL